ncbi:MAG: hypothetical protein ACC645_02980 [Pirellulales bacterium]
MVATTSGPLSPPSATQGRRIRDFGAAGRYRPARLLLGISVLLGTFSQLAMAQIAWESSPYRVSILVAFGDAAELSQEVQQDTLLAIAQQARAVFGAMWQTKVDMAPDAWKSAMLSHIDLLSPGMVQSDESMPDKIVAVAVTVVPGGLSVVAREFDGRTFMWRKPARHIVRQPTLLAEITFQSILEAFGPLARIEFHENDRVSLHFRAAGLPAGDPTAVQLRIGDVLRPIVRKNGPSGQPVQRAIRIIDWTYLVVEKVDRKSLLCRVVSGLRHPFGLRRRGRVEYLALPIRTDATPIRLQLRSRNDSDLPLAGYDVLVRNEETSVWESLGRTDWNGEITIPPNDRSASASPQTAPAASHDGRTLPHDGVLGSAQNTDPNTTPAASHDGRTLPHDRVLGSALRMLEVRSGGGPLARFPVVTGLHSTVTAKIVDDAVRIQVQGFLMEIEDELVDVVARRQILMEHVSRRLETDKIDEAGLYLDQLKQLPDRQHLLGRMRRMERTSVSKDPLVQAKIERLFEKTRNLLARFLDPKPVNRLQSEYDRATRKRREVDDSR